MDDNVVMFDNEVERVLVDEQVSEGEPLPEKFRVDQEGFHAGKDSKDAGFAREAQLQLHAEDLRVAQGNGRVGKGHAAQLAVVDHETVCFSLGQGHIHH